MQVKMLNVPQNVCLTEFLLLHVGCLSVRPDFLLLITHTLLICCDVEQGAIPTALVHILHLFRTPCLVHVSLNPTI